MEGQSATGRNLQARMDERYMMAVADRMGSVFGCHKKKKHGWRSFSTPLKEEQICGTTLPSHGHGEEEHK